MVVLGSSGVWENTQTVLKEVMEDDLEGEELKGKCDKLL